MSGTRVTCEDVETGETDSVVVENDFVVVTDGDRYVSNVQSYPKTGTTVLTIKRRVPEQ